MSSNIPLARSYLTYVLSNCDIDADARRYCKAALALMTRRAAVRRAPNQNVRITREHRRRVRALKNTDLTMHEIAIEVGLPNGGRVSEIMGGKR